MEDFSAEEFLQGFLEESGEHLQRVHENLLHLEQTTSSAVFRGTEEAVLAARADLLAELFRSFHTLKGLASMVGLREAATLSHALESVLQAMQQGSLSIDQELIDRLFEGVSMLDRVVKTVRKRDAVAPDIQPVLDSLHTLSGAPEGTAVSASQPAEEKKGEGAFEAGASESEQIAAEVSAAVPLPAGAQTYKAPGDAPVELLLPGLSSYPDLLRALGELERQKVRAALASGQFFSIVVFASNAERAARGENVDRVRQQLQEAGTLIKAAPVMSEGVFRFLFLIASPQPLETSLPLADEVIPLVREEPAIPEKRQPVEQAAAKRSGFVQPVQSPVVRVNLDRLDELMHLTGDLVRLRSRLGEDITRLEGVPVDQHRMLHATYQQIGRSLRDLRRAVLRARMVPLSETFNRMPLVVRDLARASQKEVHLTILGETNEVDKLLVEQLLDPLIHLVRNAIIHGIEPPEERAAAGKPAAGRLILRGIPEGDHILIELEDDGRGINLERVAARAAALGLRAADQPLAPEDALELISTPGFSTRERADLGAGRGVGLDIVSRMVRAFGGQMQMQSKIGGGTLFRLRLPLTLVIVDVLLVRAGQERYAAPRDAVERIIEIDPSSITHAESGEMLPVKINGQDSFYVLHRLSQLLGVKEVVEEHPGRLFGLVADQSQGAGHDGLSSAGRPVLVVDQVIDMREVVVQTFTDPLVARPGVAGATELGDGGLAVILDLPALLRLARQMNSLS